MNLTITDIVAVITAVILIYKAITLTPMDKSLTEATALEKMDSLVTRAVERGLKLDDRINLLEEEADKLRTEIKRKDEAYEALAKETDLKIQNFEKEMESLRDWAERLVHQLKALGVEPVEYKTLDRRKVKEKGQ